MLLLISFDDPGTGRTAIEIDESVFFRISSGDRDAFRELYEKCAGAVYAYALAVLHDRDDAEDVMQDTFVKIRGASGRYKPMGKPLAWIFTIARNLCMMRFRTNSKVTYVPDTEMFEEGIFSDITDAEDRMVMETAFRVLTDDERQVIILHAVTGMKHRETAKILDMPLATVLSKYSRGMKKLRKELEKRDEK